MKKIFYHGNLIPLPLRILGLASLVGGLFLYREGHLWAVEMVKLGGMSWLVWKGLEIDEANLRLRNFVFILGVREGSWAFLERYPDLLLLRDQSPTDRDPLNTLVKIATEDTFRGFKADEYHKQELYLANASHLDLRLVQSFHKRSAAKELAKELISGFGMELVQYNPGQKRPRKVLDLDN